LPQVVGDGTNRAAAAGYPRRYRAGAGNRIGAAFVGGFFAIAAAVLTLAGATLRPGESTAAIVILVIAALPATVAGVVIYVTTIARAVLTEDAIEVRTHTGTAPPPPHRHRWPPLQTDPPSAVRSPRPNAARRPRYAVVRGRAVFALKPIFSNCAKRSKTGRLRSGFSLISD
jgi:hypothetical protein